MATQRETVEKWLHITINDLKDSIGKHDIGVTGDLLASITGQVKGSDLTASEVEVMYKFYGTFVDMGVRRGVSLQDALGSKDRKDWYSSVINRRVNALSEIMLKRYGAEMAASINENLSGHVTFKM